MSENIELLRKYIRHVRQCEGVDYITSGTGHSDVGFSEEEWRTLVALSTSPSPSEDEVDGVLSEEEG